MSSRLLADVVRLRWDSVSASTSRGEAPSFSCRREAIAEGPVHSRAGSITDDEDCITA